MGTRNSTLVKINNEYKVAQYGQWDGYPSGQGVTILEILRNCNLDELKEKCSKVTQIKSSKLDKLWKQAHDLVGEKEKETDIEFLKGMVSIKVADKFKEINPHLHRDCGGEILQHILNGVNEVAWDLGFAMGESGFFGCEWCYVVDFDKNVLQVYNGNCNPEYLLKEFDLNSLPDEEEFLRECQELKED